MHDNSPIRHELPHLLRLPDVLRMVPIRRSTLWAWARSGRFPAPIKPFGDSITCWRSSDVESWLREASK